MYNRVFEQVFVSTASSVLGMLSVFVIVAAAPKNDYGIFVAALALQYVISRLILSGVLIELQRRLSMAVNTASDVPWSLFAYTVGLTTLMILVFVILWWAGLIAHPVLGMLIGVSMTFSIITLSVKAWIWYRLSILGPEVLLLAVLLLNQDALDLEKLYLIYYLYYAVQGTIAGVGVVISRTKIRIARKGTTSWRNVFAGGIATIGTMGRDRLAVAVAAFLFNPGVVAELAYLMTVVKGALSIGGTLNSVKFVHLVGLRKSINLGRGSLLLENLALGVVTLIGYAALYFYTVHYGNPVYIGALDILAIASMLFSVLLTFNHSIWYSNQVIRGQLGAFNISTLLFLVLFGGMVLCLWVVPDKLDAALFYTFTQLFLFLSAMLVRRFNVSKAI